MDDRPYMPSEIVRAACKVSGIDLRRFLDDSRRSRAARDTAIAAIHHWTNMSYPDIARFMCKKNHSSFVIAANRFKKRPPLEQADTLYQMSLDIQKQRRFGHLRRVGEVLD